MSVLVAGLAASPEVYRVGFGRPLAEIGDAWVKAIAAPIEPRVVTDAPCQEICIVGDALDIRARGFANRRDGVELCRHATMEPSDAGIIRLACH